MQEGIIAKVNEKGFGFIKGADGAKDIFFHSTDLVDAQFNDVREGDKVSFKIVASDKGPKASEITLL